jgi:hypothetical protein
MIIVERIGRLDRLDDGVIEGRFLISK